MFKLKFLLSLILLLFFQANVFAQSQLNANDLVTGALPKFFTAPAIDESEMDYYLTEGVSLDRILQFAWSKAETGYYKGAEFFYSLATQRFPNDFTAQAALATFYYQIGKAPESITQFQVARNVAVSDVDRNGANYFIQRIARESRVGKEAVDAYYLGVNAFAAGDYVSAAGWLEQSLAATPDWIEAQYWLGRSYYEYGQNFEAILNLEAVVAVLPATDERSLGAAWLLKSLKQ